jgi:hypothetical protein
MLGIGWGTFGTRFGYVWRHDSGVVGMSGGWLRLCFRHERLIRDWEKVAPRSCRASDLLFKASHSWSMSAPAMSAGRWNLTPFGQPITPTPSRRRPVVVQTMSFSARSMCRDDQLYACEPDVAGDLPTPIDRSIVLKHARSCVLRSWRVLEVISSCIPSASSPAMTWRNGTSW